MFSFSNSLDYSNYFPTTGSQEMATPLASTRTSLRLIKFTVCPLPSSYLPSHAKETILCRVWIAHSALTHSYLLLIIFPPKCPFCHAESHCIPSPSWLPDFYTLLPKIPSSLVPPFILYESYPFLNNLFVFFSEAGLMNKLWTLFCKKKPYSPSFMTHPRSWIHRFWKIKKQKKTLFSLCCIFK